MEEEGRKRGGEARRAGCCRGAGGMESAAVSLILEWLFCNVIVVGTGKDRQLIKNHL